MKEFINCSRCGETIDTKWMSECPLCEKEIEPTDDDYCVEDEQ